MLVTIAWWACTTFISLAIGNIIRKTFFTRIQLPGPVQAPWYKRLFLEPDPRQIATWAITVPNKGLIRYHGILNQERILVTSPQGVRDILTTTQTYAFQKTEASRTILRSILGDGLVVAEGQAHKLQRKLLQPAFNVRQVKGLYPLFWSKTIELINLLRERSGDEDINLNDLISRAALDIIGIGGLGLDLENLAGHSDQFFQAYMQAARPSPTAQKLRFWASILPEYMLNLLPLKRHAELKGASNAVRHLISAAVAKRRQAATSSTDKDILSILLNTGAIEEDIDVLSNQGMTFLGGGHDTVSQTMLWAICELSKHPEMQEKLRGEIRTIIPDFSITDTIPPPPMIMKILERLETLPLLTAFCNEIFRFYAAIPNLDREALSPVVVNGMKFPKGTTFMISIGGLNRNPQLWQEDPLVFDPTRWLRHGNGGVTTREGFLAFGSGPRACIGEKFGRAEISVLLAGLVGNFEMEWIGDGAPRVAFGGVVRMVEPLAVRFKTLDS